MINIYIKIIKTNFLLLNILISEGLFLFMWKAVFFFPIKLPSFIYP